MTAKEHNATEPVGPELLDRTPGNAAPVYLKAIVLLEGMRMSSEKEEALWDNVIAWLDTPLEKLPQDDVKKALAPFRIVLTQVLMQQAETPNLYWTVTQLPRPLIDLRGAMDLESSTAYLLFPLLREAKTKRYTPAQWRAKLNELIKRMEGMDSLFSDESSIGFKATLAKLGTRVLVGAAGPVAKKFLIERGHPKKKVDAMAAEHAVLLHIAENYDEQRDEMFKWFQVPYWQVKSDDKLLAAARKREFVPLGSMLLPGIRSVHLSAARSQRRQEVLRIVEALRLYAARHDGRLPEKLSDMTEVPIPINPLTGKAFGYQLDDKTAVLEADGPPDAIFMERYRITIAEK